MIKKFVLVVLSGMILCFAGCFPSETHVLLPGSGSSPDLSGEYVSTSTQFKGLHYIVRRSEQGNNTFDVDNVKDNKKNLVALAETLDGNYIILQLNDKKKSGCTLLPAQVQKDGIMILMVPSANKLTPIFSRYNLIMNGNGELHGDMPQEEYSKAVKAAFRDLLAEKIITVDNKENVFMKKTSSDAAESVSKGTAPATAGKSPTPAVQPATTSPATAAPSAPTAPVEPDHDPDLVPEKTYTNGIGMEFVLISPGSFMMGTPSNSKVGSGDERPQHKVTISKPFYMGKFEVTQAQWEAVMGSNPSKFKGRNNPVEQVSWDDAQTFIKHLNAKEGHDRYRLPTEAEWEYAARAGTSSVHSFGDDKNALSEYAWHRGNSRETTHPVGEKQPNPWGLYDVHGNVWEWVQDWYEEKYYAYSPETDPKGASSSFARVVRGGGWDGNDVNCRSAYRESSTPDYRGSYFGFRLAFSPGQ